MQSPLKSGCEPLCFNYEPTGMTLNHFWSWSSSDLLSNVLRGSFGEFIVASALNIDLKKPRNDWQAFDFDYTEHKIPHESTTKSW
ncbi:MAG: hypothetical protein ACRCUY_02435 [Thermoguttaceae bacterium]